MPNAAPHHPHVSATDLQELRAVRHSPRHHCDAEAAVLALAARVQERST